MNKKLIRGNMKYNTPEEVYIAIKEGTLKRKSALVNKSRAKSKGDSNTFNIYKEGLDMFDNTDKVKYCSYYNKPINNLTAYELIKLYDKDSRLFSKYHLIRYNIVMLEEDESLKVEEYDENKVMLMIEDIYYQK
jgi:hypothetical protein